MVVRGVLGALIAGVVAAGCTSPACADRVAVMRQTFAELPADATGLAVDPAFVLPAVDRGERVRGWAPVLHLRRDGTTELRGMDPRLDAQAGPDAEVAMGGERVVYVAIEADAPVAPHRATLRSLGQEAPLRLLVTVPTPGAAAIEGLAAIADPTERAAAMAAAMNRAAGSCAALDMGFGWSAPDRRAAILETGIAGVTKCGCEGVDVEGVTALTWLALTGEDPRLRWLPLVLDGEATRLIPGDADGAAMARIVASEPRVGFAPH